MNQTIQEDGSLFRADVTSAAEEVLRELNSHPQGLNASALTCRLVNRGFSSYAAQRAIQRVLAAGDVVLGPMLELRVYVNTKRGQSQNEH